MILFERLNYKEYIKKAIHKITSVNGALSRIIPNEGGPRQITRQLLATVVSSVLMFASLVWARSLELISYCKIMSLLQRLFAMRVASSYHMISQDTVCSYSFFFTDCYHSSCKQTAL